MNWERPLAGALIVGGLVALASGYGVLAAALLIFGAAGVIDVVLRARREQRAELLEALRERKN